MPMMTSDGIGGNTFSIAIRNRIPRYPPWAIASMMNSCMAWVTAQLRFGFTRSSQFGEAEWGGGPTAGRWRGVARRIGFVMAAGVVQDPSTMLRPSTPPAAALRTGMVPLSIRLRDRQDLV